MDIILLIWILLNYWQTSVLHRRIDKLEKQLRTYNER